MKTNQQQSLITHCPECQTYFKLFKEQLDAADGMVRCGTCTAIFNAKDSLVTIQPAPSQKNPQSQRDPQAASNSTEQTTESKITLEDIEKNLFADFQLVESSDTKTHIDSQELSIDAFLRSIPTPPSPLLKSISAANKSNDAPSQIHKPLPLAEQKNPPPKNILIESQPLVTEQKFPPPIEKNSPALKQQTPPTEQKTAAADEEVNFNLWNLDLNKTAEVPITSSATSTPTTSTPAISVAAIITPPTPIPIDTTKQILQAESKLSSESRPPAEFSPSSPAEALDSQKNNPSKNRKKPLSALKNLLADPIDTHEPKHHHSIFQLKWLFILILSLLLLATQHLYFNFSTLALDQQYRPWYEKACSLLGCQLPDQKDIRLMKAQKLIVRTHPEKEHYLMIDAIILNTAPFAQAFPIIQLSFSDIQSTQTISEVFPPEVWKNETLKQLDKMPSNTPIQISLEMKDPGAQVPNYQIHFLE